MDQFTRVIRIWYESVTCKIKWSMKNKALWSCCQFIFSFEGLRMLLSSGSSSKQASQVCCDTDCGQLGIRYCLAQTMLRWNHERPRLWTDWNHALIFMAEYDQPAFVWKVNLYPSFVSLFSMHTSMWTELVLARNPSKMLDFWQFFRKVMISKISTKNADCSIFSKMITWRTRVQALQCRHKGNGFCDYWVAIWSNFFVKLQFLWIYLLFREDSPNYLQLSNNVYLYFIQNFGSLCNVLITLIFLLYLKIVLLIQTHKTDSF